MDGMKKKSEQLHTILSQDKRNVSFYMYCQCTLCENRGSTGKHRHMEYVKDGLTQQKQQLVQPTNTQEHKGLFRLLSCLKASHCFVCFLTFSTPIIPTQGLFYKTASVVQQLLSVNIQNSPFLSPKKRVCCAGFDHWREVLSLYSTRQVMFAVPPSVTVTF